MEKTADEIVDITIQGEKKKMYDQIQKHMYNANVRMSKEEMIQKAQESFSHNQKSMQLRQ